ncbi:T9SS sorting signal type C domain-containing protein [Flavobacterium sp. XS1P27]|uniref:T9SS sorting signal type C domain-containing protein n=1 Tax=Flavobacterium sp. XS1P27 TaxID=3401724 RepID=UPI003AACB760
MKILLYKYFYLILLITTFFCFSSLYAQCPATGSYNISSSQNWSSIAGIGTCNSSLVTTNSTFVGNVSINYSGANNILNFNVNNLTINGNLVITSTSNGNVFNIAANTTLTIIGNLGDAANNNIQYFLQPGAVLIVTGTIYGKNGNTVGGTGGTLSAGNLDFQGDFNCASGGCPVINTSTCIESGTVCTSNNNTQICTTNYGGVVNSDQVSCSGFNPAPITASGFSGRILRWETSNNGTTWTGINSVSATYDPPAITSTTYYRVVILNTISGSCISYSTVARAVVGSNSVGTPSVSPTVCVSTPLPQITHTTTGATGIANNGISGANGLPAGVSAAWAANSITISGTPTVSGTFNYSIPLTGGCGTALNATGTIVVTSNKTVSVASSNPIVCIGSLMSNINHTTVGATGITGNGLSGANGLPAGVNAVWSGNIITISGTPTESGLFNYSIPLLGGCGTVNAIGTITVNANLAPGVSIIASPSGIICPGTSVTFTATPTNGGIPTYQWQNGGVDILGATNPTYTSTTLLNNDVITVRMISNAACASTLPVLSNAVTITSKINRWNGTAWSTGLPPIISEQIIFEGNFNQNVDLVGCSCLVTGTAAVTIRENRTLFITNGVSVSGSAALIFENNASLVQDNNSALNVGNIQYKRQTNIISKFDYTYWSSPVFNQRLLNVSPNTLFDKFFSFNASTDTWQQENTANLMEVGRGYIIRGPQFFPAPNPPSGIHEATFTGRPNNGVIGIPIPFISSETSNLIGNPYPSAIDADLFLAANNLILDGTLYFWTHNSPPSNAIPGDAIYNYTSNDYASYNGVGGTATLPAYLGGVIPSGKIAAGQAFFATGIAAGTAVFNNGMRVSGGALGLNNSQFFKTNNTKSKVTNSVDKHRIWLNLTNTQGAFKQMLVGYVTNATNGFDKAYDGQSFDGNEFVDFYSINDDKNLTIQGKALPFDKNDEVALGYSSTIEGAFSISIDKVDGILASEDVFIEDKTTNTIKNLKEGAYNFSTTAGSFNDRFVLRYKDKTLGTDDFDKTENQVLISKDKNELKIKSELESIKRITVFDLLGRKVFDKEAINSNEFSISNSTLNKQIVIVKVILTNGNVISKKVTY